MKFFFDFQALYTFRKNICILLSICKLYDLIKKGVNEKQHLTFGVKGVKMSIDTYVWATDSTNHRVELLEISQELQMLSSVTLNCQVTKFCQYQYQN